IISIADEHAVRIGGGQKTVRQNRLHQPVDLCIRYCWFGFRFWLFQRYHVRQAALLSDFVMITFDRSTVRSCSRGWAINSVMSSSQRCVWSQELYWLARPRM